MAVNRPDTQAQNDKTSHESAHVDKVVRAIRNQSRSKAAPKTRLNRAYILAPLGVVTVAGAIFVALMFRQQSASESTQSSGVEKEQPPSDDSGPIGQSSSPEIPDYAEQMANVLAELENCRKTEFNPLGKDVERLKAGGSKDDIEKAEQALEMARSKYNGLVVKLDSIKAELRPLRWPNATTKPVPGEKVQESEILGSWYNYDWVKGRVARLDITSKDIMWWGFEERATPMNSWSMTQNPVPVRLVKQTGIHSWEIYFEITAQTLAGTIPNTESHVVVQTGKSAELDCIVLYVDLYIGNSWQGGINSQPTRARSIFLREDDWRKVARDHREIR